MEAIETKNYTWEEFVKDNPKSNINDKKYIYRGQTNGEIINNKGKTEFVEWPIISSFNRQVKSEQLSFDKFISQQVSFIPIKYSKYKIVRNRKLSETNTISQLYFLQHYGIPTCFIDFTFHPFIALYFAISGLRMQSGGNYTVDGFCNDYPNDYYFTIYKIQIEEFKELLKIQNFKHLDLKMFVEYNDYRIDIDDDYHSHFAFDLDPLSKINNKRYNYNIRKQHSCFLMFDNAGFENHIKGRGLESFLIKYIETNNIEISQPLIYKYRIKYNNALIPTFEHRNAIEPLFTFLRRQKVIGLNLFDDIQGLKYDFNFFHQEY